MLGAGAVAVHHPTPTWGAAPSHTLNWSLVNTDEQLPPPEPGRIHDDKGHFSYVVPPGWHREDKDKLTYGTTLLTNPAQPDGIILLGPLDSKLFAASYSSYPDNKKATIRLAADMGTFLEPYPGNRVAGDDQVFTVDGLPAATTYYETVFDDPNRENGQMWVATVGHDVYRFFALWRGTASSPVDRAQAQALAESIRPDY